MLRSLRTKIRGSEVIASLQIKHAFLFFFIFHVRAMTWGKHEPLGVSVCSVCLGIISISSSRLLKRHFNRGTVFCFIIYTCDETGCKWQKYAEQSTSRAILHCLCKTKTQLHSHSCSHTNIIISISRTLIIQPDSSQPQYLDREVSSVQKFTFNVQPSVN